MRADRIADLSAILDRASREAGAVVALLADREGLVLARGGDPALLPETAQEQLGQENLRRVALVLDAEEPEISPPAEQTPGARLLFSQADRFVLALGFLGEAPFEAAREGSRNVVRRVVSFLESMRRERRQHFLGHRLISRVCDKTHVMSAEVRRMLERLCDDLLELEQALAVGLDTRKLVRDFCETLDELVAWPKGGGESFQRNLETLQASVSDLGSAEMTPERLQAMTAGLEVTIESWPLP
jgi:hypothetical protein